MNRLFFLLIFFFSNILQAAPLELDILRQQYEKIHAERVAAPHETAIAELNTKFTGALDNAIASAKQAGDLPTVLALEDDKKRLADNTGLPIDTEETPEALKKLRSIYREQIASLEIQRATNVAALLVPYTARLQELEATLTKSDRITDAKLVLDYRMGINASVPPAGVAVGPSSMTSEPLSTIASPTAGTPKTVRGDDRKAAEWVLSVGGQVEIWENQVKFRKISSAVDLPPGDLSLKSVLLNNNNGDIKPVTDGDLLVLGELQRLEFALLQKLSITPTGIDVFKTCPALKQITLQYNSLGDALWPRLAGFDKLRVVAHGYDSLPVTGIGISQLNPEPLEELSLAGTPTEDAALPEIGRFTNLKILGLDGSRVTDAGIASLAALDKLTTLRAQNTAVTSRGLAALKGVPLKVLGYGKSIEDFTVQIPEVAALFPKLEGLVLPRDVNPTKEDWRKIAQSVPKLTQLYLRSFKFSNEACEGIALLPKLAVLDLQYAPITDAGVNHLTKVEELRNLFIRDAILTDAALQTLSEMKNLKVLSLPKPANGLTLAGIEALKKQRPDIEFR